MGCDIHCLVERWVQFEPDYGYWVNSGDPDIPRNYYIFSALADVRNSDAIPFIQRRRGVPEVCCELWYACRQNGMGWHDWGYVTLTEMKAYDLSRTFHCAALVLARDEHGKPTATCRGSSQPTLGPVGEITIGDYMPSERWRQIIDYMERQPHDSDDHVRLVFAFDN